MYAGVNMGHPSTPPTAVDIQPNLDRSGIEVHRPRRLHIDHYDIRAAIVIEIGNCQRVRKPLRFSKLPSTTVVHHESRLASMAYAFPTKIALLPVDDSL